MRRTAFLLLTLIPFFASAQELESLSGIRLNFSAPSARAAGMGGATAAIFDAASVSENPAAIAEARRSVTVEARHQSVERNFIDGVDDGLSTTSRRDARQQLSRLTLTQPLAHGTVSLMYDEPLNAHSDTRSLFTSMIPVPVLVDGGKIVGGPHNAAKHVCQQCWGTQIPVPVALNANANLRLRKYGVASAWTRGALAYGASVQYHRLDQDTKTTSVTIENPIETSHDHSFTYALGAIWTITEHTRLAASYDSAAAFTSRRSGTLVILPAERTFRTPATLRTGVAVDLTPNITFAADVVHVGYKAMANRDHEERSPYHSASYHDAVELHAGTEWRVSPKLAVRAGFWRDPAHHLESRHWTAYFEWPEMLGIIDTNEKHVTAGATIGSGRARLNAAFDRGSKSTTSSIGIESSF